MIATREGFSWLVGNAILSIDSGKDKTKPNRALFRAHHSFQREMSLSCFALAQFHFPRTKKIHSKFIQKLNTNCILHANKHEASFKMRLILEQTFFSHRTNKQTKKSNIFLYSTFSIFKKHFHVPKRTFL